MVTHTRNSCSAFYPSKCTHTHTQQWTHTHREHTPGAVGSHLCCGARGAVGGSVPCSRAPRCDIEGVESAVHSLPPPTTPAGPRFELATFRLWVWLSNIRPRFPEDYILVWCYWYGFFQGMWLAAHYWCHTFTCTRSINSGSSLSWLRKLTISFMIPTNPDWTGFDLSNQI